MIIISASPLFAQESLKNDSTKILKEVIVQAYASGRSQLEVPAAIGVINSTDLNRFSPASILPAINMIPGVRMEERSPGSYRFSIRGSSLRSPFGIRNVKFYWNGLPLTDGGGNTYLNLLDFNSIGSMEIIKGPGASLYGAGTGGVVLLTSPKNEGLTYSITGGSFGLFRIQGGASVISTEKFQMNMRLSYQRSDGYRQQTGMNRFVSQIDFKNTISSRSFLSGTILSSQLHYETPGGLTQVQYDANPMQARPTTSPTAPGSVDQKAAITNNTTYAGLSFEHEWSDNWSSRIGIFMSATDFTNPTIRNYEIRKENNWGGRADTKYFFEASSIKGKITIGAEYQNFNSPITDYDNLQGTKGNVQTDDLLKSQIALGFAQIELDLPANFYLNLGSSLNYINYQFVRNYPLPLVKQERNFDPVFSPRVALLKKVTSYISVYGSVSSGFSPPSLAEVRPSTATFNNTLNSERGISYEVGLKGKLLNQSVNTLEATLALYDFKLDQTIVIKRDETGADYFVNAGATDQQGIELGFNWNSYFGNHYLNPLIRNFRIYGSVAINNYHFSSYVTDGNDFSGNRLTGVAPTTIVFGGDLFFKKNLYLNLTTNYSERLPLNDANTAYASDYFLVGTRIGYTLSGKLPLEFFAGVDNLLDQRYSLGNDLNAFGGRYFNAAAGRNYFGGVLLRLKAQKN